MTAFFDWLAVFMVSKSVWMYAFIFFGKILEVSVSTLRIVLINRGIRLVGSLLAIVEMTLWLFLASAVLEGFQTDPLKVVFYATAFGIGNFIGSWLDEKLAFGLSSVQVVLRDQESASRVAEQLREKGFGVTSVDVRGREEGMHYMLVLTLKRKMLKEAMKIINGACDHAVISVSDVKTQKGGYLRSSAQGRQRLLW